MDRPPFCVWLDGPVLTALAQEHGEDFDPAEHYGADVAVHLPWPGWPHGERLEQDGNVWYMPLVQTAAEARSPGPAGPRRPGHIRRARCPAGAPRGPPRGGSWAVLGVLHLADITLSAQHMFMELADNPEGVKRMMERWAGGARGRWRARCAGATSTPFSSATIFPRRQARLCRRAWLKEYGVDYDARALAAAREAGVPAGWHSDGNLAPVLGLLAELDLDFLGPLSPACNDQAAFYAEHGEHLAVFGGLDNTPIIGGRRSRRRGRRYGSRHGRPGRKPAHRAHRPHPRATRGHAPGEHRRGGPCPGRGF